MPQPVNTNFVSDHSWLDLAGRPGSPPRLRWARRSGHRRVRHHPGFLGKRRSAGVMEGAGLRLPVCYPTAEAAGAPAPAPPAPAVEKRCQSFSGRGCCHSLTLTDDKNVPLGTDWAGPGGCEGVELVLVSMPK